MTNLEDWKNREGEIVLREIGIRAGQNVLDFGCGTGVYTVIVSKIIGRSGKVYALDSDEEGLLSDLIVEIKKQNLKNIEIIKTSGEIEFPFPNEFLDVVLMYDILHLLKESKRDQLFNEVYRVLKKGGFASYHATHLGRAHKIDLEQIHNKMKVIGFRLYKRLKKPMFHWAWIEDSQIFNYEKF